MTHIDELTMDGTSQSAVPWWAAFGAPLVGVPLLVGLLALGSPDAADPATPASDAAFTSEQVEAPAPMEDEWVATISDLELPEPLSRC